MAPAARPHSSLPEGYWVVNLFAPATLQVPFADLRPTAISLHRRRSYRQMLRREYHVVSHVCVPRVVKLWDRRAFGSCIVEIYLNVATPVICGQLEKTIKNSARRDMRLQVTVGWFVFEPSFENLGFSGSRI